MSKEEEKGVTEATKALADANLEENPEMKNEVDGSTFLALLPP